MFPPPRRALGIYVLASIPALYILHLILSSIYTAPVYYVPTGTGWTRVNSPEDIPFSSQQQISNGEGSLSTSHSQGSVPAPGGVDSQANVQYAHFPPPESNRRSSVINTFEDYKHNDECKLNSLDLHMPFSPVCETKEQVLRALSTGGRAGYDMPFIPGGCDMNWYSSAQICDIFSRFSHIFILGDSLQRHIVNAMWIMLRKDMGFGGITDWDIPLNPDKDINSRDDCKCSLQITKHECSDRAIWQSDWVLGNSSETLSCPHDSFPQFTYHRLLQWPTGDYDLGLLVDPLPKRAPSKPWAFIMHHEMWNDVNVTETTFWLDQISDHMKAQFPWLSREGNFPRLYLTANAGGMHKGLGFMTTQGNQHLAKFEFEMRPRVAAMGMDFLGMFNMSVQSTQWDGVHTTIETNLIKAQMVLNWLDRIDVSAYQP